MLPPNILDELALAALLARVNGVVESSQVNKLVEYLESTDSFTLLLFLVRQTARNRWDPVSAARLYKILNRLIAGTSSEEERKDKLRRALGYFKWFYECWELNQGVYAALQRKYKDLAQARRDPNIPAPQGFAEEYLRSILRI
ncbi:MAG: hypothetical protein QXH86_08580 [Ignisphaera sp.]